MGCSLKEVATVTIMRALVSTSAPRTSPRTLLMHIILLVPQVLPSWARPLSMRLSWTARIHHLPLTVASCSAQAAAGQLAASWSAAKRGRMEEDITIEDATVPTIVVEVIMMSSTGITSHEFLLKGPLPRMPFELPSSTGMEFIAR